MAHHHNRSQMNKSQTFKVSSLTEECLNNLRRGSGSYSGATPKTHILGFMSEYIQDSEEINAQQVDELCCYDRMKKLLIKNDDSKGARRQQENTLLKAMQIEAKMNQMERDLQTKINLKSRTSTPKLLEKRGKSDAKCRTQHFSLKSGMIDTLKQKGYQKFFQMQKLQKQSQITKIKSIIGEQLQSKFKKVIDQKASSHLHLLDQNKLLQRKILQKNVQLQTLRIQNSHHKKYIKQLQEKLFGANNQLQNAHLIASYQKWISQFKEEFGQLSIKDLSGYIENIKAKCLDKFDLVENKNGEKIREISRVNEEKCRKIKAEMDKLEGRENQLIEANKNLKLNRQISELQTNQLLRAKQQLLTLRQLILSLYNQWYQKRTQNQKSLLRKFDKLKQNYAYEQMLNYIVFHQNKMSTNDKLNDYILKILRGIQKIRRMIFPMQSNEKLDPFLVLDKIEGWVERRLKEKALGRQGDGGSNRVAKRSNTKHENQDKQERDMEEKFLMF